MGNSSLYPFGNNNNNNYNNPSSFSRQNRNNRIMNSNYNRNIIKKSLMSSISPLYKKNQEIRYNNDRKNTYFFGYHQKSNKNMKQLTHKNINQNNDNNNIITNFKKYALFFIPQNPEENGNNQSYNEEKIDNNYSHKNQNIYMKKYKNEDKFYRYSKKSNTVKNNNINEKENKKSLSSEMAKDKDKDKINNRINSNNSSSLNRNKKNRIIKNEKSSQFVLLNNSFNKNLFNSFQEVNNDKNNNYTIIGDNNKILNDIRLTTINEPNYINENITCNNNIENDNNLNIDKLCVSQNSDIKSNSNSNSAYTSFIYNKPQLLLEQLNGYVADDNGGTYSENNFIKNYNESNDDNIYTTKIVENKQYKYIGKIIDNKKEGIGKVIYKNNIILLSLFENNKINGAIIISDIHRNMLKGYIINNKGENPNFNGYCNLHFNFTKKLLNNKINIKNIINENDNCIINNNEDELIQILHNYNNIFNYFLHKSDEYYKYSFIEGYLVDNKINDVGYIKWKNNSVYMGEIKNNMRDGIGMFKWPDGTSYEGEFIKDRMEGWGQIIFLDGKIYRGTIVNGLPHGYGEFIWSNDTRYFGNYINGQKEGFGIYIMFSDNTREYTSYFGFWKNGKQEGLGIIIKNKKMSYVKYKEGKKINNYQYEFFMREISRNNNYNIDIFYKDIKSLRRIINNILY